MAAAFLPQAGEGVSLQMLVQEGDALLEPEEHIFRFRKQAPVVYPHEPNHDSGLPVLRPPCAPPAASEPAYPAVDQARREADRGNKFSLETVSLLISIDVVRFTLRLGDLLLCYWAERTHPS